MSLYSLMGNLAHMSNTTAQEVLDKAFTKDEGFGVAFVTFPQVITSFGDYPGPQVCLSKIQKSILWAAE